MEDEEEPKSPEIKAYLEKRKQKNKVALWKMGAMYLAAIGLILGGVAAGIFIGSLATQNQNHVQDKTVQWEKRNYTVTYNQYNQIGGLAFWVLTTAVVLFASTLVVLAVAPSKKEIEAFEKLIDQEDPKPKGPNFCPECGVSIKHLKQ